MWFTHRKVIFGSMRGNIRSNFKKPKPWGSMMLLFTSSMAFVVRPKVGVLETWSARSHHHNCNHDASIWVQVLLDKVRSQVTQQWWELASLSPKEEKGKKWKLYLGNDLTLNFQWTPPSLQISKAWKSYCSTLRVRESRRGTKDYSYKPC